MNRRKINLFDALSIKVTMWDVLVDYCEAIVVHVEVILLATKVMDYLRLSTFKSEIRLVQPFWNLGQHLVGLFLVEFRLPFQIVQQRVLVMWFDVIHGLLVFHFQRCLKLGSLFPSQIKDISFKISCLRA